MSLLATRDLPSSRHVRLGANWSCERSGPRARAFHTTGWRAFDDSCTTCVALYDDFNVGYPCCSIYLQAAAGSNRRIPSCMPESQDC
jgi:hypothetical protein